jgi:UDP-N-acetylglucosamine--N-acetylmuramyl-(pentapeptide) pyrophosphoryl-undecaprenol N-acetylglucosamine transferase
MKETFNIVLTAAGTGGHIYPLVAIAREFKKEKENVNFLFIGSRESFEKKIFEAENIKTEFIKMSGLNRKNIFKNIKFARDYFNVKAKIKNLLIDFKTDFIIGTGGYITYPVVKVASKMNIMAYLQEQNLRPGLANKKALKYARKIFLPYDESKQYFNEKEKLIVSGNPVRDEFYELRLKEKVNKKNILVYGGSLGAVKINNIMLGIFNEFMNEKDIYFTLIAGKTDYENARKIFDSQNKKNKNVRIIPYSDNILDLYKEADLIIARAGASTIAEIITTRIPSILIPSPNVASNHQYYNAKIISDKKGGVLIEEKDLTKYKLIIEIKKIIFDDKIREKMIENIEKIDKKKSAEIIISEIIKDLKN